MSAKNLIVREPFGAHKRGDRITDQKLIDAIWGTPQEAHCIAVAAEEPPASGRGGKRKTAGEGDAAADET